MRTKKPTATPAPRSPTFPPSPTAVGFDDPYLGAVAPQPFSAQAFDRYMGHPEHAAEPQRKEGGGGLGKKLLSFPWTRSEKKQASQSQQQATVSSPPLPPPSPSTQQHAPVASSSLPLGFPAPPHAAAQPSMAAQQHPSVALFTSQAQSNSSLSTFRTTSSFASTNLFASSQDGWDSETTSASASFSGSLTSSPESGRDSCPEDSAGARMWRVKGLRQEREARALSIVGETAEEGEDAPPSRRNSTPVPKMVAMMLADPETPPRPSYAGDAARPKRWSTSSVATKTSPGRSPPFDAAFEKAAAAMVRRRQMSGGSPGREQGEDADDEVSPPRPSAAALAKRASLSLRREDSQLSLLPSFPSSARIPSIRFEGISMDAVFAEVEKKLATEGELTPTLASLSSFASSSSGGTEAKKQKRRSRVLSMYGEPHQPQQDAPAASSSTSTLASASSLGESSFSRSSSSSSAGSRGTNDVRASSATPTAGLGLGSTAQPLDAPRPRPYPRRTSSRPSPLNVAAANALPLSWTAPATAPAASSAAAGAGFYSPTTAAYGAFSPVPNRAPPMHGMVSPPLAGAFSPTTATPSFSSASPTRTSPPPMAPILSLGEPFNPPSPASPTSPSLAAPVVLADPEPSPALSSASTFRPYDIPELLVCPPSPTQAELDLAARKEQDREQRRRAVEATKEAVRERRESMTIVNGATKVTVVQEKKMVRVSTRAAPRRRGTFASPPLQQQATFSPSSRAGSQPPSPTLPTFSPSTVLNAAEPAHLATPPQTPTLMISPSFHTSAPYTPPSVARTDFHPALSSPHQQQRDSLAPAHQTQDEDSSDCEESLHNMLMRLNRPHTPPRAPAKQQQADEREAPTMSTKPSLSLTELALELHNTSQSRLSMLAREMGAAVSTSSSAAKENLAPPPASPSLAAPISLAAPPTSKRDRRLSKLYESDDSAARFGDASSPPSAASLAPALRQRGANPLSPNLTHQSIALRSLCGEQGGRNFSSSEEDEAEWPRSPSEDGEEDMDLEQEDDVDIESEIDKTLASIVGSSEQAHSVFSSSESESEASSPETPSHPHHPSKHAHSDSLASTASSSSDLHYLNSSPSSRPGLPRSESQSSSLTDSSFDSSFSTDEEEAAIVCLGERISCTYDVGVIGMAM
ncbi:hypothetical protein JCM10213_001526 [Rhodosporidiobolus nylandii]